MKRGGRLRVSSSGCLAEDNGTSAPTGKADGYIGVAEIGGTARIYFAVEGQMYYIDGTTVTVPIADGMPMGLLLALTYKT